MTETPKMAAASPRLIASCGAYRVLADADSFNLEKRRRDADGIWHWDTVAAELTHPELVEAYQKETGLFSPDLMALKGASFGDVGGAA